MYLRHFLFLFILCILGNNSCKYRVDLNTVDILLLSQLSTDPQEFGSFDLTPTGKFKVKIILTLDVFNKPNRLPSCMNYLDNDIPIGYVQCISPVFNEVKKLFIFHIYQECITNQFFNPKYPKKIFVFDNCLKAKIFLYKFNPPLSFITEPIYL